jgi:hypothetical protein
MRQSEGVCILTCLYRVPASDPAQGSDENLALFVERMYRASSSTGTFIAQLMSTRTHIKGLF